MRDIFATKLKELRRARGMGQEQLASVCGVSVQAVSKWECSQSYPDIELLEVIADTFGVTIDSLLRTGEIETRKNNNETADAADVETRLLAAVAEKFGVPVEEIGSVDIHMSTSDEVLHAGTGTDVSSAVTDGDLPDDGVLRVVQFMGNRRLDIREYDPDIRIPLLIGNVNAPGADLKIEIWGSTDLMLDNPGCGTGITAGGEVVVNGGSVVGAVNAGGGVTVNCASVNGPVNAAGNVDVGENINAPVNAGGDINCGTIAGAVTAGGNIDCGEIGGGASAGGNIDCGAIGGNASAGGNVDCGEIGGSVSAGGGVDCGDVGGDVGAGGDVNCGDVDGDVNAEGDVNCGDVDGDVNADGEVNCGNVGGDVTSDGDVFCDDVDGDVNAGGEVNCDDVEGSVTAGGGANFGEVKNKPRRDNHHRREDPAPIDLSNLGDYISRTVNDAMEAAFGKRKKSDGEDDE